jgi:hypothetical protein
VKQIEKDTQNVYYSVALVDILDEIGRLFDEQNERSKNK